MVDLPLAVPVILGGVHGRGDEHRRDGHCRRHRRRRPGVLILHAIAARATCSNSVVGAV
jgi:hypothetical protein